MILADPVFVSEAGIYVIRSDENGARIMYRARFPIPPHCPARGFWRIRSGTLEIEAAVMPAYHNVDNKIDDLSLFLEQGKDLPAKCILQILCNGLQPYNEHTVSIKTAIHGDDVYVWI